MRERVTAAVVPGGPTLRRGGGRSWALGNWLFAHTGGQPLYLLETLKLFREREWLVPHLGADGTGGGDGYRRYAEAVGRDLLPPSVRAMILACLCKLTQPARQLVMASAVLGSRVSAQLLWQVAELGVQAGIEALEEAVKSGMLREEAAGGPGAGWAAMASPMS